MTPVVRSSVVRAARPSANRLPACVFTLALLTGVTGCAPAAPGSREVDFTGSGPGTVLDAQDMPTLDKRVANRASDAVAVMYRSTSDADGGETVVSGAVFLPTGSPPDGGWPVVALAHSTTGIHRECGATGSPDLAGSAPTVEAFLTLGFAVAMTDYQGLGGAGDHPYLDAATAGRNVIDSVRAARKVSGDVSTRWAGFGGSQGGAAVWAANELSAHYAPELDLVGTVSAAPTADLVELAHDAAAGTMTREQLPMYQLLLESLGRRHADLDLDDYRRGLAAEKWSVLSACSGSAVAERASVAERLTAAELAPASLAAQLRLRDMLEAMALPQRRASQPMFVVYGAKDMLVKPAWVHRAVTNACAYGSDVTVDLQAARGHGDLDGEVALAWLKDRFAGAPTVGNCEAP